LSLKELEAKSWKHWSYAGFLLPVVGFLILRTEAGAGAKYFAFIRMGLGWPRLEARSRDASMIKKLSSPRKI